MNFDEISFRKAQENLIRILDSGALKEIAKFHKGLFDAYLDCGFNKEQAIRLTSAWIWKKSDQMDSA